MSVMPPLTVPAIQTGPEFHAQSVPDITDLGLVAGTGPGCGWVDGCQVGVSLDPAFHTLTFGVSITAGHVSIGGVLVTVPGISSLPCLPPNTTDRRDIVLVGASGVPYFKAGTPCPVQNWTVGSALLPPLKPVPDPGTAILAEVYVPGNLPPPDIPVNAGMIVDKRTPWAAIQSSQQIAAKIVDGGGQVLNICNPLFSGGAVGDYRSGFTDGAMTNVSPNDPFQFVAAGSSPFAPTDVGKSIGIRGAGPGGGWLFSTITAYFNSATVELANACSQPISGASWWFGTDNTARITAAVQTAIAYGPGSAVYVPHGNFAMGYVPVVSASNLRIFGPGTLSMIGSFDGTVITPSTTASGFALQGNCSNVTIGPDLRFRGDGIVGDNHYSMWMVPGGSFVRCGMEGVDIEDMQVGTQLSTGLPTDICWGSFFRYSRIFNIVGDLPGQGYGVAVGFAQGAMVHHNWIERTGRVGVYHAHGSGGTIHDNVFKDHRLVTYSNHPHNYPSEALSIDRGAHVRAHDNFFWNCFDGSIGIDPSNADAEQFPENVEDVDIHDNTFWNPHFYAIRIAGSSDPSLVPLKLCRGISVHDNNIYIDAPYYAGPNGTPLSESTDDTAYEDGIIRLGFGITIAIDDNHFQIFNCLTNVLCIDLNALGDGGGTQKYSDDFFCRRNTLNCVPGDPATRTILVGISPELGGSIVPVKIGENYKRAGANSFLVWTFGAPTNPNIEFYLQFPEPYNSVSFAPSNYPTYSNFGPICLNGGSGFWSGAPSAGPHWQGSGAPPAAMGGNGDWAFGLDGHIYFKSTGAWAQKV